MGDGSKGQNSVCFAEFTTDIGGHLVWQGKKGPVFCAGKYKIKNFILFLLTVQYEEFNEMFRTSTLFSLSRLVKYFVKVSSLISLVNFIYLILEGGNSLVSVVFICNYF